MSLTLASQYYKSKTNTQSWITKDNLIFEVINMENESKTNNVLIDNNEDEIDDLGLELVEDQPIFLARPIRHIRQIS
jgi:hypothetical protein